MIAIIDGTGPYGDADYHHAMDMSFCNQLAILTAGDSNYYRGPGALGLTTLPTGNVALRWILNRRKESPNEDIFLAGYSRGGAVAIQIAKWLQENQKGPYDARFPPGGAMYVPPNPYAAGLPDNMGFTPDPVPVRAMFLFDPVCRDLAINADGIPVNVRTAYVLFRDRTIENPLSGVQLMKDVATKGPMKYLGLPGEVLDMGQTLWSEADQYDEYARGYFGNCDVSPDDRSKTNVVPYLVAQASHGAVGGVPWPERPADVPATKMAAILMNRCLRKEGIKAQLQDLRSQLLATGKSKSTAAGAVGP